MIFSQLVKHFRSIMLCFAYSVCCSGLALVSHEIFFYPRWCSKVTIPLYHDAKATYKTPNFSFIIQGKRQESVRKESQSG